MTQGSSQPTVHSKRHDLDSMACCVLMPAYNEEACVAELIRQTRKHCSNVVVIDDGSRDQTARKAAEAGAHVIRLERNRGKGAALNQGFHYARRAKYHAVITMDADGQHNPAEIEKFVSTYRRTGIPVLIGNRMWNKREMPMVRRWTNLYMSWLLSRVMNWYVPDTQCGFRFYRADLIPFITARAERFAAESEVLLQIAHRGIRIGSVRISTVYGIGHSQINPLLDTVRFCAMLHRYRKHQGIIAHG